MKKVERKLNKAQLVTIWLLIVSIVLTGVYFVFVAIAKKKARDKANSTAQSQTVELKEGESLSFNNSPMAYASVKESEITFIDINNSATDERFGVIRQPDKNGDLTGNFLFHYYKEGDDEFDTYLPPIISEDASFDYNDLFAIESGDGFGRIYYLTYLCSALGNPLFSERIELPEDQTLSDQKLIDFGLTPSDAAGVDKEEIESTTVLFSYTRRDSQTNAATAEGNHKVEIGGKALSGTGFYFRVDNRPYVYYTNSEYFSYAVKSFSSFIRGVLVSKGLPEDSVYGPYLTTEFTSWTAKKYTAGSAVFFSPDTKKYQNPIIVVNGSTIETADTGYITTSKEFSFDMTSKSWRGNFTNIKNVFNGKPVGDYSDSPIRFTLLKDLSDSVSRIINFGDATDVTYEYTVTKIESVLTDSAERYDGTVGASDTLLKVTYSSKVGDVLKENRHAVVDITKLGDENKAKFIGKNVNEACDIQFSVTYNKDSKAYPMAEYKYVLTDVLAVFDKDANVVKNIVADGYVNISYKIMVDGEEANTITELIKISDIKEGSALYSLTSFLIDKSAGEYNHTFFSGTEKYEYMREFTTYEISEIKYFTVNEIIVSFSFQNASLRDPYFGETFYVNNLLNEYRYYGLNSGACEAAVKLLGGVGTDSNSAAGLIGETVGIGLSLYNMERFGPDGGMGLFAHKIYFEMPRMIYDASEGTETDDDDVLSDFEWVDTIGFTLYISDATYDENGRRVRYIGSDMYDVVAKVDAKDFDFVEYGFVDFWARKNLVMMDITKLDELKLDLYMTDYSGSYTFDVQFDKYYSGYVDGKYTLTKEPIEGLSPIDHQTVEVTASTGAFDTAFKQMYGENRVGDLAYLYDQTLGGGSQNSLYPGTQMTYGAAYFNTAYSILQLTCYLDNLTEEEQAVGFTKPKVMSLRLKVVDQKYYYTYDFYRIDDRRVMVSLYKTDAEGNVVDANGNLVPQAEIAQHMVSDYYIDTFAFKKLVNSYIHLLNGQVFDENIGYPG